MVLEWSAREPNPNGAASERQKRAEAYWKPKLQEGPVNGGLSDTADSLVEPVDSDPLPSTVQLDQGPPNTNTILGSSAMTWREPAFRTA